MTPARTEWRTELLGEGGRVVDGTVCVGEVGPGLADRVGGTEDVVGPEAAVVVADVGMLDEVGD